MAARLWRFEALDRLFFRDGRPMNAGESVWVDSLFPPSGQTLQGAVRAAVLAWLGADFSAFGRGQPCIDDGQGGRRDLKKELGDGKSLGEHFKLVGPLLFKDDESLFPAPLDLVRRRDQTCDEHREAYELLCVDEKTAPIECDLGLVRLPRSESRDVKTEAGKYLMRHAMEAYLQGDVSGLRAPVSPDDQIAGLWPLLARDREDCALVDREPKIGLERENKTHVAKDAMLYSIGFVRPRCGVTIGVGVEGLDPELEPKGKRLQFLGGEAKLARFHIDEETDFAGVLPVGPPLKAMDGMLRFKMVLATPALFDEEGACWYPPGFAVTYGHCGAKVWHGTLSFSSPANTDSRIKDVEIVSACVGKPVRIGGWDIAANAPRPLTSFIPAGSVYYCRAPVAEQRSIEQLHGHRLGERTEYGFGLVLVGTW